MDVKPGHCWRCENPLPDCVVPCNRCNKAVYCSNLCQRRDQARHGAVECKILGLKSCSYCKKEGDHKQCAGCCMAWYCNVSCQKKDRSAHKEQCKGTKDIIAKLATHLKNLNHLHSYYAQDQASASRKATLDGLLPQYFGLTIAYDFLQLAENEWAGGSIGREVLVRDFHILSLRCGNLNNTVLTAASLPAEYQGKLYITLNDFDPSVMARNVLFLFMLIHEEGSESLASSLATIWYSLHISKKDYKLIQTSLQYLLEINAERFQELVGGLVIISDADLDKIRDIWGHWYSFSCRIKSSSINLSQQRREWFAQQGEEAFQDTQFYRESLSEMDSESIGQWFDHGLFLPDEAKKSDLPYNNPTLTGHMLKTLTVRDGFLSTERCVFEYCVDPPQTPFQAWDCNQVKQHAHTPNSSVTGMYHAYVVDRLQKTKALFTQGRLQIHLLVSTFLDVPNTHDTLGMVNYDRIFTHILADSIGIRKLLQTFRPLLNTHNRNAVIVTETVVWCFEPPEANMIDTNMTMQLYRRDTGKQLSSPLAIENQMEYQNNSQWFMVYLRAVMMAGGSDIPMLEDIQSFKQAMQVEGLHMRDFRKVLNKLVPFQCRVNAKWLSRPSGSKRAMEWYLPQADD